MVEAVEINQTFVAIFGNHLEDAIEIVVIGVLCYVSCLLSYIGIQNTEEKMTSHERIHNKEHILFGLCLAITSFVLFWLYISHIYIDEVMTVGPDVKEQMQRMLLLFEKIVEILTFCSLIWVVIHSIGEEKICGKWENCHIQGEEDGKED